MCDRYAGTLFLRTRGHCSRERDEGNTAPVYFRLFAPSLAFACAGTDDGVGSGFFFVSLLSGTKQLVRQTCYFFYWKARRLQTGTGVSEVFPVCLDLVVREDAEEGSFSVFSV